MDKLRPGRPDRYDNNITSNISHSYYRMNTTGEQQLLNTFGLHEKVLGTPKLGLGLGVL